MLKNRKVIVAAVLIFSMLCCCAFSYASFSTQLTADSTVAASGTFDVDFNGYSVDGTITPNGGTTKDVKIKVTAISTDLDTLSLDVVLPYDFSNKSVTFPITVINNGTVDATAAVATKTSGPITIKTTEAVTVAANGATKTFNVTLTAGTVTPGANYGKITLTLEFKQPTIETAPTAAHNHS